MFWINIVNAIGASGNFYLAGKTGDMTSLVIGCGNLFWVIYEIRESHKMATA